MLRAGANDSGPTENESGTGPATPVSPSAPAHTIEEREISQRMVLPTFARAAEEMTSNDIVGDPVEGNGEEYEILVRYRHMLDGIRKLPRKMRVLARREAHKWLGSELKASRERRALRRSSYRTHRRKNSPRHEP